MSNLAIITVILGVIILMVRWKERLFQTITWLRLDAAWSVRL